MIISYVVKDGVWNNAAEVSDYESLTRDVASSVGGLPVEMRLVNSTEVVEKDETVTAQPGARQPPRQARTQVHRRVRNQARSRPRSRDPVPR